MESLPVDELISQVVVATLSVALFVLYSVQLRSSAVRDAFQQKLKEAEREGKRYKDRTLWLEFHSVGRQHRMFHRLGLLLSFLLVVRSVDPLGRFFFDPEWMRLLTYNTTAVVVVLGCVTQEITMKLSRALKRKNTLCTPRLFRVLAVATIIGSNVCFIIYFVVSNAIGNLAYFCYLVVIETCMIAVWNINVFRVRRTIQSAGELILKEYGGGGSRRPSRYADSSKDTSVILSPSHSRGPSGDSRGTSPPPSTLPSLSTAVSPHMLALTLPQPPPTIAVLPPLALSTSTQPPPASFRPLLRIPSNSNVNKKPYHVNFLTPELMESQYDPDSHSEADSERIDSVAESNPTITAARQRSDPNDPRRVSAEGRVPPAHPDFDVGMTTPLRCESPPAMEVPSPSLFRGLSNETTHRGYAIHRTFSGDTGQQSGSDDETGGIGSGELRIRVDFATPRKDIEPDRPRSSPNLSLTPSPTDFAEQPSLKHLTRSAPAIQMTTVSPIPLVVVSPSLETLTSSHESIRSNSDSTQFHNHPAPAASSVESSQNCANGPPSDPVSPTMSRKSFSQVASSLAGVVHNVSAVLQRTGSKSKLTLTPAVSGALKKLYLFTVCAHLIYVVAIAFEMVSIVNTIRDPSSDVVKWRFPNDMVYMYIHIFVGMMFLTHSWQKHSFLLAFCSPLDKLLAGMVPDLYLEASAPIAAAQIGLRRANSASKLQTGTASVSRSKSQVYSQMAHLTVTNLPRNKSHRRSLTGGYLSSSAYASASPPSLQPPHSDVQVQSVASQPLDSVAVELPLPPIPVKASPPSAV